MNFFETFPAIKADKTLHRQSSMNTHNLLQVSHFLTDNEDISKELQNFTLHLPSASTWNFLKSFSSSIV